MMRARAHNIGIALSADRVTAVVPGTTSVVSVDLSLNGDADITEKLAAALEQVRSRLASLLAMPLEAACVDVALLPPYSDARLIPLPPLKPVEAEAVIRRDAARHFVGGNGARTIAVSVPPRVREQPLPVLAVAASTALIEQLHAAFAVLGWQVRMVVPAVGAWLAAARKEKKPERLPRVIVAQHADMVHIVRSSRAPEQLRRVPLSSPDELLAAIGRGPGRASVWLDDGPVRSNLVRALTAAGWQIDPAAAENSAAVMAALHAGSAMLELIPPSLTVARMNRQRRRAVQLFGLAALLIIAAGAFELWGAQRELSSVRARRAAIRQQVLPLLAVRDTLGTLEERLSQIKAVQNSSPYWTAALFDLSMLLPADAYLRSLRATGDTLIIEASGSRAGETIQALRSAPTLRDVQLRGQVERQLEDGSTSVERFTLQARLAGRDSTAADTTARAPATGARQARTTQLREGRR